MAWRVRGQWKAEGSAGSILTGDALAPGALLQPVTGNGEHSIIAFLPDGQQVMYECFQPVDCDRSFRVPKLLRQPDPLALEVMARIRAVLGPRGHASEITEPLRGVVITALEGNRADISGPVASLPDGSYTYAVTPLGSPLSHSNPQTVAKQSRSIPVSFPGPGLFTLELANDQKLIHASILVAALEPSRADAVRKSFDAAHNLLKDFAEDYGGWPVQEFERDYLRSLVLNIAPDSPTTSPAGNTPQKASDRTAEPTFTPAPAIFPIKNKNNAFTDKIQVALHCSTPGAVIHYTVDTSQPFRTSPAYQGPITVMGIELTIKAFAISPGKKDSSVVTGVFRFEE